MPAEGAAVLAKQHDPPDAEDQCGDRQRAEQARRYARAIIIGLDPEGALELVIPMTIETTTIAMSTNAKARVETIPQRTIEVFFSSEWSGYGRPASGRRASSR